MFEDWFWDGLVVYDDIVWISVAVFSDGLDVLFCCHVVGLGVVCHEVDDIDQFTLGSFKCGFESVSEGVGEDAGIEVSRTEDDEV